MLSKPFIHVLLLTLLSLLIIGCSSTRPDNVNLPGKLSPCPNKPNCVHTESKEEKHQIASISYAGEVLPAYKTLLKVIEKQKRTKISDGHSPNHIHVEYTTALMRFVDDVDFSFDEEAKVIRFRSASRVGHSDLGANRKRMEEVRKLFVEATK